MTRYRSTSQYRNNFITMLIFTIADIKKRRFDFLTCHNKSDRLINFVRKCFVTFLTKLCFTIPVLGCFPYSKNSIAVIYIFTKLQNNLIYLQL